MFNSIYFHNLRNHEFSQFIADFVKLGENKPVVKETLGEQFTLLKSINEKIAVLMNRQQGSNLTQVIETIDDSRDATTMGISMVLEGYTYHYDPIISEAAKELLSSIKKFGTPITRTNYQEQTSFTTQWINEWKNKPALASHVLTLNLGAWMDKLYADNTDLNNAYLARVKEESIQPDDNINDLRKQMTANYRELLTYIQAHMVISKQAEFSALIDETNVLIDKYNKLGKTQSTVQD